MRSKKVLFILLSLMLITACSSPSEPPVANNNSPAAAKTPEENNGEIGEENSRIAPVDPWEVSEVGVGSAEIGMTVPEAGQYLGASLAPADSSDSCHYVKPENGPGGISFMIIDGRIARIDVDDQSIPTSVGARVGDSEDRIKMLYMNQVEVTPHKYTGGHYLTVVPANGSSRIIFETDGSKVTRYRAGRMPEVEWVEGCS